MIELYFWPTPNGQKAAIMLEELGVEYQLKPININQGDQHEDSFVALNPNRRIPVIVDTDGSGGEPYTVIESGAILLYLAEKTGQLWPADTAQRYEVIQWVMFQMGNVGPMLGQYGHFFGYAPEQLPYAIARYKKESLRLYGILNDRLAEHDFLAGGEYSLADIATYPWLAPPTRKFHDIKVEAFPHILAWCERLEARPAVQRGMALLEDTRKYGDPDTDTLKNMFGIEKGTGDG